MSFAAVAQQGISEEAQNAFKAAQKQAKKGDLTGAESLFRRSVELDPGLSAAKVELAYVLLKQRSLTEAYELSLNVAKAEPKNSRAFAVLGATLLTAGRFADAAPVLQTALALDRKEDLALAGLGLLNFYENRIQSGLVYLRAAVYQGPSEPDYLFALGQIAARAENYKEAADAYRRFLIVAPDLDSDRRSKIKGLVNFLDYLGQREKLYLTGGEDQTIVPFKLVGNRPVIQLRLNDFDRPLNFVLDTGSGISVISDKTAQQLKIRPVARGGFAKGIGGDGKFEIIYGFVRMFSIGGVKIKNVPVYIRKFHSDTEDIDGYIGLSLISKFLTTIDYGSQEFALTKKDPADVPGTGSEPSLPLRLTSSGFLSGEVLVPGVNSPLNFIVDTGASVSVISDDLARIEPFSQYSRGDRMRVIGSAGVTENVPSLELPRVTFGSHSEDSITAIALDLGLINEASGFQQSGILGGNFLRNYRLTFDFKKSRVTFSPVTREK
jgi:tetratricopeptide (TPR) repeat protein